MASNKVVWTHDLGDGSEPKDITLQWVQNSILENFGISGTAEGPYISDFKGDRIAMKEGVLSHIIKVKLEWTNSLGLDLPSSVVIKLFSFDGLASATKDVSADGKGVQVDKNLAGYLKMLHNQECKFYVIWSGEKDLPFRIPRCYHSQPFDENGNNGIIIFEDLSEPGVTPKFVDLLNLEQVLEVAENLGRFHAWCYSNPSKWQSIYPQQPKKESVNSEENNESPRKEEAGTPKPPSIMRLSCEKLLSLFPEDLNGLMDVAFEHMDTADGVVESAVHDLDIPPVLVHKDCWMGNLMYRKETDSMGDCFAGNELMAIVDWQTACSGCPSADLARLIWGSTPPELRRGSTEKVLEKYYSTLTRSLQDHPIPFTYDKLKQSYDYMTVFGMARGVFGAAINILSVNPIPETDPLKNEKERRIVNLVKCALEDAKQILAK